MQHKLFTAFLSSNYSTLKDTRATAIEAILDSDVFPISMEHFVISSSNGFDDICELIDNSDMFILIMGLSYGSCDVNGMSWTEKEYRYVISEKCSSKPKILIVRLKELTDIISLYNEDMTDEELKNLCNTEQTADLRKQINFSRFVDESDTMVINASSRDEIKTILTKFINTAKRNGEISGWIRGVSDKQIEQLLPMGKYYHCHFCDSQREYLRVGEIDITRDKKFHGYRLHFEGTNYKATIKDGKICENETKYTIWNGNYLLDFQNKMLEGIFTAQKTDIDNKGDVVIKAGKRDGIHRFSVLNGDKNGRVLVGTSQDAVTENKVGKECTINVFNSEEARDAFVKKYFDD